MSFSKKAAKPEPPESTEPPGYEGQDAADLGREGNPEDSQRAPNPGHAVTVTAPSPEAATPEPGE